MKRVFLSVSLAFCLLLYACGGTGEPSPEPIQDTTLAQDAVSTEDNALETSHTATENVMFPNPVYEDTDSILNMRTNSAYEPYQQWDSLAVILNEPFEQSLVPTVTWREGAYDRAYIIPRYVGSYVNVYGILWDEESGFTYTDKAVYSTYVEDGCVIFSALERPEGMPRWYVEIIPPYGLGGGLTLTYNGNTGTPAQEFITMEEVSYAKPVIYLYPERETQVTVELDYDGELTCTYPAYENGWCVTAQPDGTLTDAQGQSYNYLYWEGKGLAACDFSQGFCVPGEDTAEFLESALEMLGLNRREANEFIVYWLPLMEDNPYNIIAFQTGVYAEIARLEVSPDPDTLIRVFMAWCGSETPVQLPPQDLTTPERTGFTVIEWGGSEIR